MAFSLIYRLMLSLRSALPPECILSTIRVADAAKQENLPMRKSVKLLVVILFVAGMANAQKDPAIDKPTSDTLSAAWNFSLNLFNSELVFGVKNGKPPFDPKQTDAIRNGVGNPMGLLCSGTPETCAASFGTADAQARYLMENFRASTVWLRTDVNLQSPPDVLRLRDQWLIAAALSWADMRNILCRANPLASYTTLFGESETCGHPARDVSTYFFPIPKRP
jgi:hypothetical protein